MTQWIAPLLGGAMIGAASALILVAHGRIAGVSGIVGSLVRTEGADRAWRVAFVAGLIVAGVLAAFAAPDAVGQATRSLPVVAVAGLMVGVGTRMGGGCTSGHGVCGIGRLSARSLVAVMTFMATGALTVWLSRSVA